MKEIDITNVEMTDTEMIDQLAEMLKVGTVRIGYNDDEDMEDDWGMIPMGFYLRIRSDEDFDLCAPTLRELFLKDKRLGEMIHNDSLEDDDYDGEDFSEEDEELEAKTEFYADEKN